MATEKFINELKNRANANRLGRFDLQMYDRFEKELKGDTLQNGTPTPDTPIPIQNVTGLQNINVCGKNLCFNVTKPSNANLKFFINKSISKTFTISFTTNEALNGNSLYLEVDGTGYGNLGGITASANTKVEKTYTLSDANYQAIKNGTNIDLLLYKNGANFNIPDDGMVENNSTATEYEPYKGNTYEVNLGKNLLNIPDGTYSNNGITAVSSNGIITLNGTATNTSFIVITLLKEIVAANQTLTISNNNQENISDNLTEVRLLTTVGDYIPCSFKQINNSTTRTNLTATYNRLQIRTSSGVSFNNFVIKPMLEKGSTATTYAPYFTPIELNKIGTYEDSIKKSSGKQLFDKDNANILNAYFDEQTTTITSNANNRVIYIPCSPNTTYTITKYASPYKRSIAYTTEEPNIGVQIYDQVVIPSNGTTGTITTGNNAKYLVIRLMNTSQDSSVSVDQMLSSVMINEGSTTLPYEPYLPKGTWYVEKQARKLELAIADMNNSDNYPGWKNLTQLYQDYPNQNKNFSSITSFISNIHGTLFTFGINTNGYNNGTLWIYKSAFNYTQEEWKTNYSDLVVSIVYGLQTPEITEITNTELISQLEAVELLKGENNITITSENLPIIFDYSFWNGDTEVDVDDRFLEINQSNHLTKIELKDSCCVNNNLLGTTYTKSAEVELLDLPVDTKLEGKKIIPEIGVRYDDDTTDYETFDNFTIESLNDEQTASNTKFTAMSGGTLLDSEYICSLSFENGQTHTINEFYQDALSQIGITPTDTTFDNSEIEMTGNPFTNKESIRILISEVEKVSCTIIDFDWKNKTASMTWLSDQIDYEFNTSDYSTLEGSLAQYGPLNTIIIANAELNGENVVMKDDISAAKDGEHQIIIDSPYFLYTEALRRQAIEAIYNKLVGLTYYDIKLTTPYGKPFLKKGNKIRINTNEGQTYDTYVLTHTLTYDGTIQSVIESPALTQEEQTIQNNIKNNTIKERVRRTELMVDKTTGEITAITEGVTTIQDNLSNNYYTKDESDVLVQTAKTGLTNTFSKAGGNNIFRNTGLWFTQNDTNNPFEFWNGNVVKAKEEKASNYSALLLQNATLSQEQLVPNGNYTISFKYKKLVQLAKVKCIINDIEIELDSLTDKEIIQVLEVNAQHINIQFVSDTANSCEIYDLMVNAGSVKLAYSQNQNETTTDTVNISKGITITSSDIDVTFKANADGIRTLDRNGTRKTEFTDTGMITTRATIEEEAEVVSLLHKRVGNHIWVNKI